MPRGMRPDFGSNRAEFYAYGLCLFSPDMIYAMLKRIVDAYENSISQQNGEFDSTISR